MFVKKTKTFWKVLSNLIFITWGIDHPVKEIAQLIWNENIAQKALWKNFSFFLEVKLEQTQNILIFLQDRYPISPTEFFWIQNEDLYKIIS